MGSYVKMAVHSHKLKERGVDVLDSKLLLFVLDVDT